MAGVEKTTPARTALSLHAERSSPSSKRSLPNGPCNHRDVNLGPCGCDQFWDTHSAELHEGSTQEPPNSKRTTWCVCGHHACFHLREARAAIGAQGFAHTNCDDPCQAQARLPRDVHNGTRAILEQAAPREGSHGPRARRFKPSEAAHSQPLLQPGFSQAPTLGADTQPKETPSQVSASGLPRVPSICLTSHDQRQRANAEARQGHVRGGASQIDQQVAGLGLSLLNSTDLQQSVASITADDINKLTHASQSESEHHSTRPNSVRSDGGRITSLPRGGPMDQILEFNRTLQLDVGSDTIPNTYNPDDFLLSATEVATPSNANTPDLGVAEQAVHETKELVDTLMRLTSQAESHTVQELRPASVTSATSAPLLLTNSPALPAEQLQQALRSGSPQVLQKLVSYLGPLHNLLTSMPSVAGTMQQLTTRMDYLENSSNPSFNHMPPEEIQQLYDVHDVRLLELETRMNHHEELHRSIDADQSSNSHTRRRIVDVTESFGSNQSIQSTTSSAMILAAIERKEMETEVEGIKERLEVLEAAAMPSFATPWEVEVVLLPWGPELRGIWFSPDEPMHDPAKVVTQDSEEWTQGIHMTRQPRVGEGSVNAPSTGTHSNGQGSLASSFAISDAESGWSSQAIEDWAASSVDEWLFAKACGSNNLVYRRLQSRGFVREVTLKSANARDIQGALSSAFGDLLHHLKYTEDDRDPTIDDFPALQASFIPLRKAHKESKLRFLTPAEMSSSALWSAQFLASGVMMRVSGGKKRLYVTQREGYLQQRDPELSQAVDDVQGVPWTWQDIRQLPRYQSDTDSHVEGNDEQNQPQVAEADAREACWAFVEAYDLPPPVSVNSSFSSSHHSAPVQLSMRPADRQWRRSITPSSILKNRQPQPLSPLSVAHPPRPAHLRGRTFSASIVDQVHQASSKRPFNASPEKHSSVPHSARIASVSISRPKRRRVASSPSPRPEAEREQQGQVVLYNTIRRSREPPSPFYSSHPELARTNSDGASVAAGKATPFAYATPYSGPVGADGRYGGFGEGAGDTEPDDDYQDDDGEQSWSGVDEDEDEGSDGELDAVGGAEMDPSSISGEDSGFGSEDGEDEDDDGDDDGDSDVYGFDAQQQTDEDGDEIFDTLLGVLEE